MDLEARIQARLAKQRQVNASTNSTLNVTQLTTGSLPPRASDYVPITAIPVKSSAQVLAMESAKKSQLPTQMNPSIQALSAQTNAAEQNFSDAQRELAQTRSRMYSQERQLSQYETELRNKDAALRKTLAEATGERTALVESLAQTRAQVDHLRIELEQKQDLLQKSEAKLSQYANDFQEMQAKFIKAQQEVQELKFNQQHSKDSYNVLEAKNNILQAENDKLNDQVQQLSNADLECKVIKQNLAQIQHEFASLSTKYEKECENNKNIRAEYINLKQEYSVMLQKFADNQEDYNNFKQLKLKYEDTCKQYNEISDKFRNVAEKNQEMELINKQNTTNLQNEKNAGNSISQLMIDVLNNTANNDTVLNDMERLNQQISNAQLTNTYQKFVPVLSKIRALVSQNQQFQQHIRETEEQNVNLQKQSTTQHAKITEYQLQIDNLTTSNERLNETLKQQTSEFQSRTKQLQSLDQEHQKLILDIQLALNQINSVLKPDQPLPANVQNIQGITSQLTQMYNAKVTSVEELKQQVDRVQTENTNLNYQLEQQKNSMLKNEEDATKYKALATTAEEKLEQNNLVIQQLRQQQTNISQFIQLLLCVLNQTDRRVNLLTQQSNIANLLLTNYLIEQHAVRTMNISKAESARLKLRRAVYAIIFMNKLIAFSKITKKNQISQIQAIRDRTNNSHENLFNQTNQMVTPIINQSGDLQNGLATISSRDQRDLVNKVLNNFMQMGSVVQYFNVTPINTKTGQFTFFKNYIQGQATQLKSQVDSMNLQLAEVNKQNNVLQISIDQYKKENEERLTELQQKESDLVKIKNGIEQYYIEKREYDQLRLQKEDLEQKLNLLTEQGKDKTRQITTMEVDIQTFQNEITRLNDQLRQNDQLVKTITNKYDTQLQTQQQMKELILNYETQIKQRQSKIEELEHKIEEERVQKQAMQRTMDSNLQQMSDIRSQLEQRDRLISDLQLQIEKENRLRVLSEQQLLREKERGMTGHGSIGRTYTIPTASLSQSMIPAAVNVQRPSVTLPSGPSTYNTKREIKDLINQLNTTFDDDL